MKVLGERSSSPSLACRVPVTDPTLRLLVLTQMLQRKEMVSGRSGENGKRLPIGLALGDICTLSWTELARFSRAVSPQTIAIDLRESQAASVTLPKRLKERTRLALVFRNEGDSPGTQFVLSDATLKTMVFAQLLNHVQSGANRALSDRNSGGFQAFDQPGNISALEALSRSMPFSAADMQVSVDLPSLAWEATRYRHIATDEDVFDYFVQAQASTRMLVELFKATPTRIRTAQTRLNISPRTGRCVSPTEEECMDIVAEWDRLACVQAFPMRDMFYAVHQKFTHLSMAQIYGAVKKERRDRFGRRGPQGPDVHAE